MLVTSIGSPNSIVKPPNGLYFPVIANGIIFALVFLDRDYFEQELQKLKNRGMYPYSFVWEDWKPEISLKHTLVNWAMFFLPIKSYARLLNKIVGKKRK